MNYQTFANSEDHTHMKQLHTFQNKQSTVSTRKNLYNLLNGNIFYHINQWPIDIQIAFNNTPISDTDTFKIILFFFGNGCPPHYIIEHLYTSYAFQKNKIQKRFYQIKWICNHLHTYDKKWHYHDIHLNKRLFLDGSNYSPIPT